MKIKDFLLEKDLDFLYNIIDKIEDILISIKRFFRNLKLYWPILISDDWYDFYFFENLILHKLKDLEKHWGKDTHYEGDCFTKKRIQVLLRKWQKIQWYEDEHPTNLKEIEEMKIHWFKEFGRLLPRLWD